MPTIGSISEEADASTTTTEKDVVVIAENPDEGTSEDEVPVVGRHNININIVRILI